MTPQWWRLSITFMGAGTSREDALARLRALVDGMPLMGLNLSATPMPANEALRILDREQAKQIIDADADSGRGVLVGIMGMPSEVVHPHEQGAFIFPDDHPLAPYERLALQQGDEEAIEKLKELDPGSESEWEKRMEDR